MQTNRGTIFKLQITCNSRSIKKKVVLLYMNIEKRSVENLIIYWIKYYQIMACWPAEPQSMFSSVNF